MITSYERLLERSMTTVPDSKARYQEALLQKTNTVQSLLNHYNEGGVIKSMYFRGDDHKKLFEQAMLKPNGVSRAFLAAIYLLTVDNILWSKARRIISRTAIDQRIRLGNISEEVYALFMTTKDLYADNKTTDRYEKHINISDQADKSIVSQTVFSVICNAMILRRYGMNAKKMRKGVNESVL